MKNYLFLFLFMATTSMTGQSFFQQQDKHLHFTAGNIAGAVGYTWSFKKHQNKKRAQSTGICTAFAAGVLKEMYDASQGGYVEHADVLATTLGGLTMTFTIPLFQRKQRVRYRQLDTINGGYKY